jgi:hypothetical protein
VSIQKREGDSKFGCFLVPVIPATASGGFPGNIAYRFELVKRSENRVVQTWRSVYLFDSSDGWGLWDWIDPATIQDHILKLKIRISFSKFVKRPSSFEVHSRTLLSDKLNSNISFKVGDEVVYALYGLLSSRSHFFRKILDDFYKDASIQLSVESEIPFHDIEIDLFKMIIEWLYTMDILQLDSLSSTILEDLERLFIASKKLEIRDLCNAVGEYLETFVNRHTFGDIYQIAKRTGNKTLEIAIFRSWISNYDDFNKSDDQIEIIVSAVESDRNTKRTSGEEDGEGDDESEEVDAILEISRQILRASGWTGDKESKICVIKYFASSLSFEGLLKKS